MSPNGRRAWRRAAKKLRRKMGRRWRSPNKWSEKRWSELVPDLEAHRGHVTGAWFRRHGFAELDPRYKIRQYIGLWGTVDGDGVEYAVKPKPFTPRSLVGMSQSSRKRAARQELASGSVSNRQVQVRDRYRIGERLRPCPGCPECEHGKCWCCDNCGTTKGLCDLTLAEVRCKCGKGCGQWWISYPATTICDGSGVLPAKHQLCWL